MPDDEKKNPPEPKKEDQEPGKPEEGKRKDLIVDITDQVPPGWGTSF